MGLARTTLFAAAALALALVACGGDSNNGGEADVFVPQERTELLPELTDMPCAGRRAPGTYNETIESGALARTYILHIPPAHDRASAMPLVLNFHGFGSNARNQAAYSRIHGKADEAGFIAVTPDGAGQPQQWNNFMTATGVDDLAFVRELLDHLQSSLCTDAARVYAIGISNGSAFAQRLACALPGRIAGVAAVAALVQPRDCQAAGPVPLVAFHGTEDRCVPYQGGVTTCGRGNLPVLPAEEAARRWAEHNRCRPEPAASAVSEHVRAIEYAGCAEGSSVVLYAVEGGGHTWPGSIDVPRLGAVTSEIDATDVMWDFFSGSDLP